MDRKIANNVHVMCLMLYHIQTNMFTPTEAGFRTILASPLIHLANLFLLKSIKHKNITPNITSIHTKGVEPKKNTQAFAFHR